MFRYYKKKMKMKYSRASNFKKFFQFFLFFVKIILLGKFFTNTYFN